jgi:hypothetical protein
MTVRISIEIEPIREEVVVEVGNRIDPKNTEPGVRLTVGKIVWFGVKSFAGGIRQKRRINHI